MPRRRRRLRPGAERLLRGGRARGRRSASPATTTSLSSARSPPPTSTVTPPRPSAGRSDRLDGPARAFLEPLSPSATRDGGRALPRQPDRSGVGLRPQRAGCALELRSRRPRRLVLVGHSHVPLALADEGETVTGGIADGRARARSRLVAPAPEPGLGRPAARQRPAGRLAHARPRQRAGLVPADGVPRRADAGGDPRARPARVARGAARRSVSEPGPRSGADRFGAAGSANVIPSRARISCTSSRALKIRHLTVVSVISSESAISLYGSPTTSRSSSAIFRSGFSSSTARQIASIASIRSIGWSNDSSVRHVVDVDDGLRPPLAGAQLVEHAVLRHLEEPRRELAAERESRQPVEDADEDLLRQILGQRAVARQPVDVVEDRRLVRPHDERERALVPPLGLAQDVRVRLGSDTRYKVARSRALNRCRSAQFHKTLPVIRPGELTPSRREDGRREVGDLAAVVQLADARSRSAARGSSCGPCAARRRRPRAAARRSRGRR